MVRIGVAFTLVLFFALPLSRAETVAAPAIQPATKPASRFHISLAYRLIAADTQELINDQNKEKWYVNKTSEFSESDITIVETAKTPDHQMTVNIKFTEAGSKKLAKLSTDNLNQNLALVLDDKLVAAVHLTAVAAGTIKLTDISEKRAKELEAYLNPDGVKFVGVSIKGQKIVYVLDATGSMMSSFDDLRRLVKKSVNSLKPEQSFNIVFINDKNPVPMAMGVVAASPENKRKTEEYVDTMAPRGGTEPVSALDKAYSMKPDAIALFIDPTDIPDRTAMKQLITKQGGEKVRLYIIAFEGKADPDVTAFLKNLAKSAGGEYRFITAKELSE